MNQMPMFPPPMGLNQDAPQMPLLNLPGLGPLPQGLLPPGGGLLLPGGLPNPNMMPPMGGGPMGPGGMPMMNSQFPPILPMGIPFQRQIHLKQDFPQDVQSYFKCKIIQPLNPQTKKKLRKLDPLISEHFNFLSKFEEGPPPPQPEKPETQEQKIKRLRDEKLAKNKQSNQDVMKNWNPYVDQNVTEDPFKTIIIYKLNFKTTEQTLQQEFEAYGPVQKVRIVRNEQTESRGYGFVEFEKLQHFKLAYQNFNGKQIDGTQVYVDFERGRTILRWRPRRFGGGLGETRKGQSESQERSLSKDRSVDKKKKKNRSATRSKSHSKERAQKQERSKSKSRSRSRSQSEKKQSQKDQQQKDQRSSRQREKEKTTTSSQNQGGQYLELGQVDDDGEDRNYNQNYGPEDGQHFEKDDKKKQKKSDKEKQRSSRSVSKKRNQSKSRQRQGKQKDKYNDKQRERDHKQKHKH